MQTLAKLGTQVIQFITKNWVPLSTGAVGLAAGYGLRANKTTIVNKTVQAKEATSGFVVRAYDKFTSMFKRAPKVEVNVDPIS